MCKVKVFLTAFILSLAFVGGTIQTSPVQAQTMAYQYVSNAVNKMAGDWYDSQGNLVLSIADGYINGCQVVAGYDFAGGSSNAVGVFRILEDAGYRNIKIQWSIHNSQQDHLVFNGTTLYRG